MKLITKNIRELLGVFINIFAIISVSTFAYFWYTKDVLPVKVYGYRVGTDNFVHPGSTERVLIMLNRDIKRKCEVSVNMSLATSNGIWYGNIYSLNVASNALQYAEKTTPGEYLFDIKLPLDASPGPALLFGTGKFRCLDNPIHNLYPATYNMELPVTIK